MGAAFWSIILEPPKKSNPCWAIGSKHYDIPLKGGLVTYLKCAVIGPEILDMLKKSPSSKDPQLSEICTASPGYLLLQCIEAFPLQILAEPRPACRRYTVSSSFLLVWNRLERGIVCVL